MIKEAEVKTLEKEIVPFAAEALSISVTNAADMTVAAETLTQLNRYADAVEERRESVTKPLNAALKAARALFKPLEEKVATAISSVRGEMIRYQTEATAKAEKEAASIAARIGEGKGKLKIETAANKLAAIDNPAEKIASDTGVVQFIDVPCFEVTDKTKLPPEFLVPDEVAIRAAMKSGKQLEGVRYWVEKRPRNTR